MNANDMRASAAFAAAGCDGVLLGHNPKAQPASLGFGALPVASDAALDLPIIDFSEGHCLTIAPTGAGKGRNIIIPNLLSYAGPVIVIDPKGEAARVTARRRREMGQRVVVIDPFRVCGGVSDGLNPFDLLDPKAESFASDCYMLAKLLTGNQLSAVDRFWDQNAESLLAGVIAYLIEFGSAQDRNLVGLRRFLCDADLPYKIALALDNELKGSTGLAREEFQNFLGHEGEKVRTSVRSTAMQHMTIFAGGQVADSVRRSSFCLPQITAGHPLTIYLVIPPHKLEAYGTLLRLWVATLLTLITRREEAPPLPTLFILDELAQLGAFPLLRPAVTLLRGYGVRCMLFLQDASQLRALFPADYSTIVNNCASLLSFGHTSYSMSREMAEIFGDISADQLFSMGGNSLAVRQAGRPSRIVKRADYLADETFAGTFDANRMASAGRPDRRY